MKGKYEVMCALSNRDIADDIKWPWTPEITPILGYIAVLLIDSQLWPSALQKRPNWSRCRLGCWLRWNQGNIY